MTRGENATAGARDDYVPGDPAKHVIGPDDEQSARVHAPLPRRKRRPTEKTILADIKLRRQTLEPSVEESKRLTEALKLLSDIK